MNRKVERLDGDSWVEIQFQDLKPDDVFRLWDPVTEPREDGGTTVAWRCRNQPEMRDGQFGCDTEPAFYLPGMPAATEAEAPET